MKSLYGSVAILAGGLLSWLFVPGGGRAQTSPQVAPAGDAARGEVIALSCSRCHGESGMSNQAWIPNLAGLKQRVIYKQLEDYRSHRRRPDWYMGGIAQALSRQDSADVAAYYERQVPDAGKRSKTPPLPNSAASCGACHDTQAGDAPKILGQQPQYLEIQLSLFSQGIRTNDQGGIMQNIAHKMTFDEIRQLSEVLGQQTR